MKICKVNPRKKQRNFFVEDEVWELFLIMVGEPRKNSEFLRNLIQEKFDEWKLNPQEENKE
jgi:hypothetical protein